MVERRELITICRQIGTMMEVGVDFLRLTRVLREQTENPRLLELYDQIEHEMRMGETMADAIAKAPDIFSPFAVSLIRQGEARGDIEGAWHRLADSLKQEAQEDRDLGLGNSNSAPTAPRVSASPRDVSLSAGEPDLLTRFEAAARRVLIGVAIFLGVLCALWLGAQSGYVPWNAMVPLQLFLSALWLVIAASWPHMKRKKSRANSTALAPNGGTPIVPDGVPGASIPDANLPAQTTPSPSLVRPPEPRTEELLRNFAPTFPVADDSLADADEDEDDYPDITPPNSEKRFHL